MLSLLFVIISYGSLLLLLMPSTKTGVIGTAALFVLGLGFILYKKAYKIAFWKGKKNYSLPAAVGYAAFLGWHFYHWWLPSSKMHALAAALHLAAETMLLIGASVLSLLSVYFIFAVFQAINKKISGADEESNYAKSIFSCVFAAVVTVALAQIMANCYALSMGHVKYFLSVLFVLAIILLLFSLMGKVIPSVLLGAGLFMIIFTVNAYVYDFRERLFEPVDVYAVGAARNVAENYSLFPAPKSVLIGWGIFAVLIVALFFVQRNHRSKLTPQRRIAMLAICFVGFVSITCYAAGLKTYHWHNQGAMFNGYVFDFVSKFKEITVSEPKHYSPELIAELAEQYAPEEISASEKQAAHPHIIVIMDESFSDLRVAGDFSTNTEVIPFISSLKENTISGYSLVSVYGGNTANTEYEFLTGNSLAWLSPNVVPYQQYVRSPAYSMVSYLKSSYGYKAVAMHPFKSSGWNRPAAYGNLGFDECHFEEDFPQQNYLRNYISDREMFEYLIDTYESLKDHPLFIFGVSMQNHGDYSYDGENFTQTISLMDYEGYPEVEQYLSLIHETDKAVEYLLTYFESADEDVVIVFFGDHQPKIKASFYEKISGNAVDSLDEQQKRFKVPFFIWANFDIEEKTIECTSINYLSSLVYETAGIALPPYNMFLREMEKTIPVINANGFYSFSENCFLPFDEANADELRWLNLYEALQYNSLFDSEKRNKTFFPALEK